MKMALVCHEKASPMLYRLVRTVAHAHKTLCYLKPTVKGSAEQLICFRHLFVSQPGD